MIKFFRKIRQQLLTENKFIKYLLYAIGEIILVVIGILIAININNKNELQKNERIVVLALKEIQNNLLEDINNSQRNVNDFLKSDSIQTRIFDFENPWTFDDYKNNRVERLGNFYFDFVINKDGYENLMRHIDKLPVKYEPILKDIKEIYVILNKNIQVSNERIRNTVYANIDFNFKQNWIVHRRKYSDISKEEIDYYINDDAYKRSILKFMNDRRNVFRNSQRYRVKAIETYIKIDSLLNLKNRELPLDVLGQITSGSDYEKYLGTYTFLDETTPLSVKFYIEQNQLFSIDNSGIKLKQYKIGDNLYMYMDSDRNYPFIWKFIQSIEGRVGVDFLNNNNPDLVKKTD